MKYTDCNGTVIGESRPAPAEADGVARLHLRDRLLSMSQLANLPLPQPLVDGFAYQGTVLQLSGPPGSYKSFMSVGMAVSVAVGESFESHAVPEAGPVVYVAPEGASGLRARILAYCELAGIDPARTEDNLFVLPTPIQLGQFMDVSDAVDITTELKAKFLILDTRARCTLGLEENSSTEQGKAIDAAERIIDAAGTIGTTILGVHHSARNGSAGRGSNAWDGAVWSDLRITGENLGATVTCHKHKDAPSGCEHHFRLVPHTVSEDLMPGVPERQRQTLVIISADGNSRPVGHQTGKTVLHLAEQCGNSEGLTRAQLVALAKENGVSQTRAYEAVNELLKAGVLINISKANRARFIVSPSHRSADQ